MHPLTGLLRDRQLCELLRVVEHVVPGAWLAAGAIRNRIWDERFGPVGQDLSDVDVAYYDANALDSDAEVTAALRAQHEAPWEAVNQAGVHLWRDVDRFRSAEEGMAAWPETATCVGLRLDGNVVQLFAPWGIDDLLQGVVRRVHSFPEPQWAARQDAKCFHERWLGLRDADPRRATPNWKPTALGLIG